MFGSTVFKKTPMKLAAILAVLSIILTACDSAGPEAGAVSLEDFEALEQRVGTLEEGVGALEDQVGALGVDEAGAGGEQADIVGQDVTVSAEVSEVITTTDVGSAFRIGGENVPSVAVLSGTQPEGLDANDVVQISGTVRVVQRTTFEDDFGFAEDDLFEDPDGFFDEFEGELGIAATSIEVLQEQSEG